MTASNKSRFASEAAIHLNIEDHVAFDLLESNQGFAATCCLNRDIRLWFECNADILHFFSNGFLPEIVSIFTVELECLFNRVRKADTKLVSGFPIMTLDL